MGILMYLHIFQEYSYKYKISNRLKLHKFLRFDRELIRMVLNEFRSVFQ